MSAVFLKILNMSITAGWLILAVILARQLLKPAPKWTVCLLWGMVALRLICPFSLESMYSLIPSSEPIPAGIAYQARPAVNTGIAVVNDTVNAAMADSLAPNPWDSANPLQIIIPIAACLWVMGVLVMLVSALIRYRRLKKTVAACLPAGNGVFACDEIETPFILGIWKPVIYVPSSLGGETLQLVLLHEQAHLRRRDHWWKPLGYLLLSLHWFNPLCWIAYVLLCRDLEMACDEKVIRDMDRASVAAYSQAILDCSFPGRRIAACPLAFGEVGVKERVKGVLNYKKPAFWLIGAAVLICLVIAVCFLTNPMYEEQDLSFLNYKNAISLIGQNGVEYVISCPPGVSEIQVGDADDRELARYLENCRWTQRRTSPGRLSSPGSVQFVIEEGYRITVYQRPRVASVQFEDQIRYYRIGFRDYAAAAALVQPGNPEAEIPQVNPGLEEYRTDYIGDATKTVGVAQHLPYPADYSYSSIEIQSDEEPYGLTVYVNGSASVERTAWEEAAGLAFEYIGNLGTIRFCRADTGEDLAFFDPANPGRFYLTVGADGVKSIEVSSQSAAGGCENADGSLYTKGETLWLEPLDGLQDLCGVTVTAKDAAGKTIWTASIPDTDENKGFSRLVQDGWEITNLPVAAPAGGEEAEEAESESGVLVPYARTEDGAWEADGRRYQYCLVLHGRMRNARYGSAFTVLSNDPDVTFEEVAEKLFSSQSHTAFDDRDAVFVRWDVLTDEEASGEGEPEGAESGQ